VAVFKDVVLQVVDDITLPRNDAGHDIGKVFNEVDNEPQGAGDSQSVAKFHPQLIDDFQRVEAGGHDDIRIDIEMDYPKAIRITVEFKVEITQHSHESAVDAFEANVDIRVEEYFAGAWRNSLAGADPFFRAGVGETEMEPDGTWKPSIRLGGDIPLQRLRESILAELEAADQSSGVRKFDHRVGAIVEAVGPSGRRSRATRQGGSANCEARETLRRPAAESRTAFHLFQR
jgi:hypothetical protein